MKSIICIGGPTGAGKSAAAATLGAALGAAFPTAAKAAYPVAHTVAPKAMQETALKATTEVAPETAPVVTLNADIAASGKLRGGVVVNADSRQVYADFPIITAQPGQEETNLCRHELYGFLPTQEKISAGRYLVLAAQAIEQICSAGQIPILTGGTGLYFRSLLRGIADIPAIDPTIHDKWQLLCAEKGSPTLHADLQKIDPDYAGKIHPNDRQRITRALEVHEGTGKPLSWWHREKTACAGYRALYIGVGMELGELEPLLRRRIDLMLTAGAIQEGEAAMRKCSDPSAPGWSGIGCAEVHAYLQGSLTLDECKELWFRNTRAYAKRQLTWFRAEPDIHWFRPGEHERIQELVSGWLDSATGN